MPLRKIKEEVDANGALIEYFVEDPDAPAVNMTRITEEHLEAVEDYIRHVKFCMENFPKQGVASIWACGCMGPLPECRCMRLSRLVNEFLEAQKEKRDG